MGIGQKIAAVGEGEGDEDVENVENVENVEDVEDVEVEDVEGVGGEREAPGAYQGVTVDCAGWIEAETGVASGLEAGVS